MSKFLVVGVKRWKGVVDGKAIDSAKLFVQVRLDDSRNGSRDGTDQFAKGIATEEIKLRDGQMLLGLESYLNRGGSLPCMVELETDRVSNGRESREVVMALTVVEPAPAARPAPAKLAA